ncbi:MAG: ABC transporter ATP-binding protein [Oscillospiraceae bacterium]|nr:ABC transporter ATP-binding protein [Oscillospiraceae bacterium]
MDNIQVSVENLVVEYKTEHGNVQAVNGVNIQVKKGKTLGIVGETGAGKTTTALAVLRLIPNPPGIVKSGKIIVDGEDISGKSEFEMNKIRGGIVSMIFQDPMTSLNPVLTVGDQIAESIGIHQGLSRKEAMKKAEEMLEMVGIPGYRSGEYPHQFSGGMKQRVGIAIALSCNPQLLIADEPTTALDVTIQAQVLQLMKSLRDQYGTSMIMITHDLGIVAEVCDDVAIMYGGRIIEQGTLEDIFKKTKHPYTEGLFNSLPNLANRTEKLKPIRGLMPDPARLPSGCVFHPRCLYAQEICQSRVPQRTDFSDTHMVCCLAYEEGTNIEVKGGGRIV